MEVDLEVNTEETMYMMIYCFKNAELNYNTVIGNKSFENLAKFKYLGMTAISQIEFMNKLRVH
jgi:hypothetical protein